MSYSGLGEDVASSPPDWKEYSPLDDDVDAAVAQFIDEGELDAALIKGAVQTYAAATAASACAATGVGAAVAPICGYIGAQIGAVVYDIADSVVTEIGDWFTSDPPPPSQVELRDVPETCATLFQRWTRVEGLYPTSRGIYAEMMLGLMVLKQELGLPGVYDWETLAGRMTSEYGVRLVPQIWNGTDTLPGVGAPWATTQAWVLVNERGEECLGTDPGCAWQAERPAGIPSWATWRTIPEWFPVAPPMLTGGRYFNSATGRWTLAQQYRLCRMLDDNPFEQNDTSWTESACESCLDSELRDWVEKFIAAVAMETTWLHNLAEVHAAIARQQYADAMALQESYAAAAAAFYAVADVYEATRPYRQDQYLLLLVDFLGLTRRAQGKSREDVDQLVADALTRRGMDTGIVLRWIAHCDPPLPPGWDPVECFQAGIQQWETEYPAPRRWLIPVAVVAAAGAAFWLKTRR